MRKIKYIDASKLSEKEIIRELNKHRIKMGLEPFKPFNFNLIAYGFILIYINIILMSIIW